MRKYSDSQLKKIFSLAEKSLFQQSGLSNKQLAANFNHFKTLHDCKKSFRNIYWIIVQVTFYSGFKAATVNKKLGDIKKLLGDYKKVATYKSKDIKSLSKNEKIIRHEMKIKACVENAKQVIKMINEFATFDKYLSKFGDINGYGNLTDLIKDLKKRFKYLGGITVFHFLTDIGLNVLKPDRVICRIFKRLGFVDSVNDYQAVINTGKRFAQATGYPIRYIDIIFVFYGQVGYKYELDIEDGICLEKNPHCNDCSLKHYCDYYKMN